MLYTNATYAQKIIIEENNNMTLTAMIHRRHPVTSMRINVMKIRQSRCFKDVDGVLTLYMAV